MTVLTLSPVSSCCGATTQQATIANPTLSYDSTLGDPNAQGIKPPFTNLTAFIYDITGAASAYGWNPATGLWT